MRGGYRIHRLEPHPELEDLFQIVVSADKRCMVWGDSVNNHCPQTGHDESLPASPEGRAG